MRCRAPSALAHLVPLLAAALVVGCEGQIEREPTPLKVLSTVPANGETGVAPEAVLRVEFDDALDARTVLSGVVQLTPPAPGSVVVEGRTLVFRPYEPLQADTPYLAEVTRGVRGLKGGTLAATHGFRFTTRGSTTDIRAPASVSDLSVEILSGTSVKLAWTATGDDGLTGTATRYDLRWAKDDACPIGNEAALADATPLPLPAPLAAGTAESTTVESLPRRARVCFGLVVVDEFGNRSPLSATAPAQLPDLVPPADPVLTVGTVDEERIQLLWTAVGDDGTEDRAREYRLYLQQGLPCTLSPETAGLEVDAGTSQELAIALPAAPGTQERHMVLDLQRDTDYCFLLRVRDTGWNAAWSNVLSQRTPDLTPPFSPVVQAQPGLTEVQLSWTAVGDDAVEGTVTRQDVEHLAGKCPVPGDPFPAGAASTPIPVQPAGTQVGHVVTGLTPDTDHCFRVVVADNVGQAAASDPVEVHTVDPLPPADPVITPSQVGTDVATLSWLTSGDNGLDGPAVREELWTAQGATCAAVTAADPSAATLVYQQVPSAPGTPRSFTLTALTPDEDHCVLLIVKDETGAYGASPLVTFRTLDDAPPFSPTVLLDGTRTAKDALTVTWLAPGDNGGGGGPAAAQSLRYWQASGPCGAQPPQGAVLTVLPLPAPAAPGTRESATLEGLSEDTPYCIQVSVEDEVPNAASSNVLSARTLDVTDPAAPVLTANLLEDGLSFEWDAVGDNGMTGMPARYEFRYRAAPCDTDASGNLVGGPTRPLVVVLVTPVAGRTRYREELRGLTPNETWCGQVVATDEVGRTGRSGVATGTTNSQDVIPPSDVSDLVATRFAGLDTVVLEWSAPAEDRTTGTGTVVEYRADMATGADCVPPGAGAPFQADAGTVSALQLVVTPTAPGTRQTTAPTASGLSLGEAACFRLSSFDEASNLSLPSNLAFPPAPVTTLAATSPGNGSVELSWTAVGAHQESGRALGYALHVRSGLNRTCPTNARALLLLSGEPAHGQVLPQAGPALAGAPETARLTQLPPDLPVCVALEVYNQPGDRSFSNVLSVTVRDDAPPGPFQLDLVDATTDSADFTWTDTFDNGVDAASGPPSVYRFLVVAVPAPAQGEDPCAQSLDFSTADAVQPTNALTVTGLQHSTWYCAQMQAVDNEGLAGFSPVVAFQTDAQLGDGDPPARPTLSAPLAGHVRSLSTSAVEADLSWLAVPEDGQALGTDPATRHVVLYRDALLDGSPVGGASDCDALNALQDARDRTAAVEGAHTLTLPTLSPSMVGEPLSAVVTFSSAPPEQPLCVALRAVDDAGPGPASAWIFFRDNTAPGTPADFQLASAGTAQVTLSLVATGDDDTSGAARTYQLEHVAGACADVEATFDTLPVQVHDVSGVVPGLSGSTDTLQASTGLQAEATYCFRVRALDDAGNASPWKYATATLPSAAAEGLQALRDALREAVDQGSPPVVTGLSVQGATVTYVKPDLSQDPAFAGADALDTAEGFFVQGGPEAPALFVRVAGHGLLPGERVDLADVIAERLAASGTLDPNGMAVITSTNVTPRASAGSCPAVACKDGFSCESGRCNVAPRDVSALELGELAALEHQRVSAAVVITGGGAFANGFVTFPVMTVGTVELSGLTLLLPGALAAEKQLKEGVAFTVTGTPLWREGISVQLAAFRAEDLEVPTRFQLEDPPNGTVDVPVSRSTVQLKMNHPPAATPQGGTRSTCEGAPYVEVSADGFQTCVEVSVQQDPQDPSRLTLTRTGAAFEPGRRYRVRLPGELTGDGEKVSEDSFVTEPAATCTSRDVVISRLVVENGGYVEVHNRSSVEVDLAALGLEVAVSDVNASRWTFLPLSDKLPPGGYTSVALPVQFPLSGAVAALVPADADGDGISNFDEASAQPPTNPFDARGPTKPGYVPDGCPPTGMARDLVGFGASLSAGCSLGQRAPTPAAGQGLSRRAEGCVDHGDNAGDFDPAPILPARGTGSPVNTCRCAVEDVTGSGLAAEADYCELWHPASWHDASEAPFTLYGRVYEAGRTEPPGEPTGVRAEFGLAPAGTPLPAWTFRPASYNVNVGNDDEYVLTVTVPATPGATWRTVFRVSVDDGVSWTWCDTDGSGANAGLSFSPADLGALFVCTEGTQPDGTHAACVP